MTTSSLRPILSVPARSARPILRCASAWRITTPRLAIRRGPRPSWPGSARMPTAILITGICWRRQMSFGSSITQRRRSRPLRRLPMPRVKIRRPKKACFRPAPMKVYGSIQSQSAFRTLQSLPSSKARPCMCWIPSWMRTNPVPITDTSLLPPPRSSLQTAMDGRLSSPSPLSAHGQSASSSYAMPADTISVPSYQLGRQPQYDRLRLQFRGESHGSSGAQFLDLQQRHPGNDPP